jgi:hypothetical protein
MVYALSDRNLGFPIHELLMSALGQKRTPIKHQLRALITLRDCARLLD